MNKLSDAKTPYAFFHVPLPSVIM